MMTKDQSPWCCINVSEELTHVEDSSLYCGVISNESKTGRIKWTLVSWLVYKKKLDVEEIAYWNLIVIHLVNPNHHTSVHHRMILD